PSSTLCPYTTLFRSDAPLADHRRLIEDQDLDLAACVFAGEQATGLHLHVVDHEQIARAHPVQQVGEVLVMEPVGCHDQQARAVRSEEHTSELQSREN